MEADKRYIIINIFIITGTDLFYQKHPSELKHSKKNEILLKEFQENKFVQAWVNHASGIYQYLRERFS